MANARNSLWRQVSRAAPQAAFGSREAIERSVRALGAELVGGLKIVIQWHEYCGSRPALFSRDEIEVCYAVDLLSELV